MRYGKISLTAMAVMLVGISAAQAATVKGRITMIDEKNHQITVNNSDVYSVAPNVDLSTLGVGSEAQLDVSGRAGAQTVTAAKKAS